jgi:hypothetical protein
MPRGPDDADGPVAMRDPGMHAQPPAASSFSLHCMLLYIRMYWVPSISFLIANLLPSEEAHEWAL